MLPIADVEEISLNNFPGRVACTAFTIGCNLRCRFCYNRELVLGSLPVMNECDVWDRLRRVQTKNLVILGGEPLVHFNELKRFLCYLKEEQFTVKLDTNGTFPDRLAELIENRLVDYVAVDIKAFSKEDFEYITRSRVGYEQFFDTVRVLDESDVDFELRYTAWKVPDFMDLELFFERLRTGQRIKFYVQKFIKNEKLLDKSFFVGELSDKIGKFVEILRYYCEPHLRGF